jgi:hypothetical protein
MDARDFLAIAERLRNSGDEAERRTSVGRSYYTLFNVLIGALGAKGVIFRETADDHQRLVSYLSKGRSKTAAAVGATLRDLRLERNRADYDLRVHFAPKNSDFVYQKTVAALRQFDSIPEAEMDLFVQTIQALP